MSSWDNYNEVAHQLGQLLEVHGLHWKQNESASLKVDAGRKNYGKGSKCWYRLHTFAPRNSTRRFIVGAYGCWKDGKTFKVDWDREGLSEESLQAYRAQQEAAREKARLEAEEAAAFAVMAAGDLLARAVREGSSPYLQRKGVEGESCRYLADRIVLGRRDPRDKAIILPAGTLVLPLLRYDKPRDEALRGLQFIKPDGFKVFTEGFAKSGCSVRLGKVTEATRLLLVCEGYATGLSIRMATDRRWPVFVALDAYNLLFVVEILRDVYPTAHILVCADDDWKTADHEGPNPGRRKALKAARATPACEIVWPVFDPGLREKKDTDFNDLHAREGIGAVERQLMRVLNVLEARGA